METISATVVGCNGDNVRSASGSVRGQLAEKWKGLSDHHTHHHLSIFMFPDLGSPYPTSLRLMIWGHLVSLISIFLGHPLPLF